MGITSTGGEHRARRLAARAVAAASSAATVLAMGVTVTPVQAAQVTADPTPPDRVSFTLEGCRNDGSITLPDSGGRFVCPGSAYTSGNLGKGWAELDLVPFRVTAKASTAAPGTQTYTIATVVDLEEAGKPGYDVLSPATLNTSLSDASCQAATVSSSLILAPGIGGISKSLYRTMTVTQDGASTCVYDYYARLALGSHLFPGSSLHANLGLVKNGGVDSGGIGAKDVSIPVNEIEPQSIGKDMAASRGSDHTWNVTKQSTPSSVDLGDTCDTEGDFVSASIDETVTWTKSSAIPGATTITTNIYATNPSSRPISVTVSDKIYAGTTQTTLLDTASFSPVAIPPRTTQLVGTHTYIWLNATSTSVNDVATATYIDVATGIAVPGSTTASASATIQDTGPVTNATAVIDDTQSITGSGLEFSVDSVTGATGSFTGYTLGNRTTDPILWTSTSQSASGSVVFRKTIYAARGTIEPAGVLTDVATALGSDGFASAPAEATVDISVDTTARLSIDKTIPAGIITRGSESAAFTFDVVGADDTAATKTITLEAGETSGLASVTGLVPAVYTVVERDATNWKAVAPQEVDLRGAICTGSAAFENTPVPAETQVLKVTVPDGFASGWTMALLRGDDTVPLATGVTDDSGIVSFGALDTEGTYRIVEEAQDGWKSDGGTDCEFTIDLPADGGTTFRCTFTNTFQPTVDMAKSGDELSKVGDNVAYRLSLANTSPTGGPSGAPDLECRVLDEPLGFDESVTLSPDDSAQWGPIGFTIPSGSDPYVNEATASCAFAGTATEVASASSRWSTNLFQPKLSVTKQADRPYAQVGDTITYTVTIENTGSSDSPALIPDDTAPIVDPLVPGLALPASCDSLAVGETCSVTYDYVVQADDSVIPNTAEVLFHPRGFPNDVRGSASASVTVIHPNFTVTKTCATPNFPPGSTVIFRVDVANTGDVPVRIVLDDSTALNGSPFTTLPLTGANTTATATSDVTNADLGFDGGRVSFELGVGKKAQVEISLTTTNITVTNNVAATATLPAAYGGTDYRQTLSASDFCVDPPESGATRTIGFWRTHLSFLRQVLDTQSLPAAAVDGASPLGVATNGAFLQGRLCLTESRKAFTMSSVGDVMGVFWASNSWTSQNRKRTVLCQAKIITGKQLLGAILNQSFSNPAPLPVYGGQDLITATLKAMDGTNATLIRTLGTMLDEYNNVGDDQTIILTGSLTIGKADPTAAKTAAILKAGDC